MISPQAVVFMLVAATLLIIGLGARLFANALRQGRNRRWASELEDARPGPADEEAEREASQPAIPPSAPAPVLEMPIRAAETALAEASSPNAAAALEEQSFEAARDSLNRIVDQSKTLLASPDVRLNEKIDLAVRGMAAESGWLLQALEVLMRLREQRQPDTELCSVAGLLQSVDEHVRLLAADRRNVCSFENAAGELWLLADAALLRGCALHFVSSACVALKDAHISVRVSRAVAADGCEELRWTVSDDGHLQPGRGPAAPFWLLPGQSRSVLNLALAEEAGSRLGGSLEVIGVPGHGGSVTLTHPVIVAGNSAAELDGQTALSAAPGEEMHVLAVGGDGETNSLLQRCFAYYGHHVSFAANIIEAARATEPVRPDAIVCDLDSPECASGLLALALAVGHSSQVPILGVREVVGFTEDAPAGCLAVIAKSEAAEKLVSRVRDLVRRGAGRLAERPPTSGSSPRVLIVDSDDESIGHLAARLEAADFSVCRAESARSALVALETREFDAAVVAEILPDMSGLELLRILRSRFGPSELPVLLSGAPVPQTVVQAIAYGANDFLAKPLELAVTIARISTQLARKRAEQALRVSEERYMLTARGANDGLWDWDCRSGDVHFSPRWKEMIGLHPETVCHSVIDWLSRVHPEDRPEVERQLDEVLRDSTADEFVNEHRMLHLDGLHRWVLCRAVVLHDDLGRPVRVAGSHTDITRTKASDSLTGLANRVMFNDRIGTFMDRFRGDPSRPFSVLFLDLDRFKIINDSLGHAVGDQLLIEVGNRISHVISAQFPESRHVVARLGGDEFGVILMPASEAVARGAAETLLAEIQRPLFVDGCETMTTASIGVASVHSGYLSVMDLVRDADTAMYRAKANGKARYEVFDATMRAAVVARAQLGQELSRAVSSGEFVLYYQPKIELATGRLAGFEALMRWRHPERGLLAPSQFIPVAEETGLIVPLGLWVIDETCRQLKEWSTIMPGCRISLNVSTRQFQEPGLAAALLDRITAAGINPSSLQLEITESVVAEETEQAGRVLAALKATGVELELDDFGTGYSSLSRLAKLPLDTVKIDRSFVSQLRPAGSGVEIVRAILSLAASLHLKVVAEGVETEEQLLILTQLGCPVAQGFLFSAPAPAETAADWLVNPPYAVPKPKAKRGRPRKKSLMATA